MRRAIAAALFVAVASSAAAPASAGKLGVCTQSFGAPSADVIQASLETFGMLGQEYTLINVDRRTWGQTSMADSVYWRTVLGIEALIVLAEDGQSSGVPMYAGPYGDNFQNAAGVATFADGPLSGRWGIPVYVFARGGSLTLFHNSYDDLGADRAVVGIRASAPAGTFFKTSVTGTTWRYRTMYKYKDGVPADTLYDDPVCFACVMQTWLGPGTVAALSYVPADSFPSGFGSCPAGDTASTIWRYRPVAGGPGVTYYLSRQGYIGGNNLATRAALQSIYSTTSIRPTAKILVPHIQHDGEAWDETNATSRTNHALLHRTVRQQGIGSWVFAPMNPGEYGGFYNAATLAEIRTGFEQDVNVWAPFSYSSAGVPWDLIFYNASDTAGVRVRFNQTMRTTSAGDSGGFMRSRMDLGRLVSGSGVVGGWQTKVLADAGVDVVETTLSAPNGAGWALIAASNGRTTGSVPVAVPGAYPESRVLWVQPTYGYIHGATFGAIRGGADGQGIDYEYVGGTWISSIGQATMRRTSLYWHTNTVTNQDPYFSWLLTVAARHFRMFDLVMDVDRTFANQVFTPRRKWASRYN